MRVRVALGLVLLAGIAGYAVWWRPDSTPASAGPRVAPAPSAQAAASEPSALSLERAPGPVADPAGALSHFGHVLENQARAFAEDLGIDVHVAALAAPEQSLERLAPEIFELRRIGARAPTGGLLVLLNPARREARIEVSYALESVLPDALVGRIAEEQLAPYAASGMAGMAVMDALHFLKDFLTQLAVDGRLALDERYRARPSFQVRLRFLSGGGGSSVAWPSPDELAKRDFKAPVPAEARARYAPAPDPLASAEAFLRAQRDLAGDPSLELFTEGSRCMRRGYPVAPYEELERARRLDVSRPWRVIEKGDRAVVTSERPAHGFVPVLLHRVDGLWRVDLAETWKNLAFDYDGNYIVDNASHPYGFGLAAFGAGTPSDVEAWDLGGAAVEDVLAALRARPGPLYEFLLAELLFRNCFLSLEALQHYEAALRAAPHATLFRDTLARRADFLALVDLAIETWLPLRDDAALDLARAYEAKRDVARALEWAQRAAARNPYDREALELVRRQLEASGDAPGAREIAAKIEALVRSPERKDLAPVLRFDPPRPTLEIDEPTEFGGEKIYDYARFTVSVENPSGRPIEILSIHVTSAGTGFPSGLGDMRGHFSYPSGAHRLEPGQSASFYKVWGFTEDAGHGQLSYFFDVCWRGDGDERQCRKQRLDLFPR